MYTEIRLICSLRDTLEFHAIPSLCRNPSVPNHKQNGRRPGSSSRIKENSGTIGGTKLQMCYPICTIANIRCKSRLPTPLTDS